MFSPRADKVLFAATKADHLHHSSHDRLEAILRRMVDRAVKRAEFSGAEIDVVALSAVRATREAIVSRGGESLPSIAGVPAAGEKAGGKVFDGQTEVVVFPGDLPDDPDVLFAADDEFAARHRRRTSGFAFPAFPAAASGNDRARACPLCRIFASIARCNS